MARIIRLFADPHTETQQLLPWYVGRALEGAELARVEAHLRGCAHCRADLEAERGLKQAVAELPLEVENGWAAMRERLEAHDRTAGLAGRLKGAFGRGSGLGWAIAAEFAIMVALVAAVAPSRQPAPAPAYRTLGQPRPAAAGDIVVVFRPDAREGDLRQALRAADARIVAGPTAADAYVLQTEAGGRGQALVRLRSAPAVALAEPIDPGDQP